MTVETIDASIVICTYNRAALLRDALASLVAQQTDGRFRYEVVVIDNASTDDTPAVIEDAGRTAPVPFRGVREAKPGVAAARNRGIAEARGEWVAFFDDDQVADPRWLAELVGFARDRGVRCVGGANRLLLPPGAPAELPPVCRALLGEPVDWPDPRRYDGPETPGAGNLLLHRSVFEQVGRFDESLREAGEDTDLLGRIRAAGIEAWYTPLAVMHHVVPAYRATAAYFRWKAQINGGHVARKDHRRFGRALLVPLLAARLGQAAAVRAPRLLWSRLRGDAAAALGARCALWRTEGYARFALNLLAPRLFPQRAFFDRVEFRGERELFVAAGGPVGATQPALASVGVGQ